MGEVLDEEDAPSPLAGPMRTLWEKLEARVLPYDLCFLETALELASSKQEQAELAHHFWSRRTTLVARVADLLDAAGLPHSHPVLTKHLLDDIAPSADDAARAFALADDSGASRSLRSRLAVVLLLAVEHAASEATQSWIPPIVRRAKRLLGPRHGKRKRPRRAARQGSERTAKSVLLQTELDLRSEGAGQQRDPR
jgi:hypothetical protein